MKSSFQTILIIVFGIAFVIAIAVFSGLFSSGQGSSSEPEGTVVLWGVLPAQEMGGFVSEFNSQGLGYTVNYFEHPKEAFAQDLTVALANGVQPDAVILSSEIFSQFKDKLYSIPYAAYSERAYRDANVDGAQIFLSTEGVASVPLLVDPLVIYYNKDILASENFAYPPRTWGEVGTTVPAFTKRDARGNITQSSIAFGEGANVSHFRDIISALFLQTGNQIVAYDAETSIYRVTLSDPTPGFTGTVGVSSALDFYTSFSNPTNGTYTWNRSLPTSRNMFISGRLAFYIGRASELFTIQSQNPNLNFDVAEMFQPELNARPITFGSYIGASVMKSAPNFNAAYAFLSYLSETPRPIDDLSKRYSLPPARRDLLIIQQNNPYVAVFFRAALSAFAWPDPDPTSTETIFRGMIQGITSGRSDSDTAINEATRSLQTNIR